MFEKPYLNLLVPGLLGPLPSDTDSSALDIDSEMLEHFVSFAKAESSPTSSWVERLIGYFGLARESAPIGAISYYADYGHAPKQACFRCDPIHQQLDLNQAILFDGRNIEITQQEADALVVAFNAHFKDRGFLLSHKSAARWYLQLEQAPALDVPNIDTVVGKNVAAFLPRGEKNAFWAEILTEVQMLFHEHEVNKQRESTGLPAINGVWIFGGGDLPEFDKDRPPIHYTHVYSDHILCRGLCQYLNIEPEPLPAGSGALLEHTDHDGVFICDGMILDALISGGVKAWQEAVMEFEQDWMVLLWNQLQSSKWSEVIIDPGFGKRYSITPGQSRRFWRRRRDLNTFMNTL